MIRWNMCKRCGIIKKAQDKDYCPKCEIVLRIRKKEISQRERKKQNEQMSNV